MLRKRPEVSAFPVAQESASGIRFDESPDAAAESCAKRRRRRGSQLTRRTREETGLSHLVLQEGFARGLRTINPVPELSQIAPGQCFRSRRKDFDILRLKVLEPPNQILLAGGAVGFFLK